jgi:hypothetical protein
MPADWFPSSGSIFAAGIGKLGIAHQAGFVDVFVGEAVETFRATVSAGATGA